MLTHEHLHPALFHAPAEVKVLSYSILSRKGQGILVILPIGHGFRQAGAACHIRLPGRCSLLQKLLQFVENRLYAVTILLQGFFTGLRIAEHHNPDKFLQNLRIGQIKPGQLIGRLNAIQPPLHRIRHVLLCLIRYQHILQIQLMAEIVDALPPFLRGKQLLSRAISAVAGKLISIRLLHQLPVRRKIHIQLIINLLLFRNAPLGKIKNAIIVVANLHLEASAAARAVILLFRHPHTYIHSIVWLVKAVGSPLQKGIIIHLQKIIRDFCHNIVFCHYAASLAF